MRFNDGVSLKFILTNHSNLVEQTEVCIMTEESANTRMRHRIESLSDLIFGLALSIGALTLIGQPPSDFPHLLAYILYYGFSFLILISIWRSYTRIMTLLPVETNHIINLNILLLFLVSIEPYLFNQLLFSQSLAWAENVSIVYAFDLGALFMIQTFFANSIVSEKKQSMSQELVGEYKFRRYILLISAVLFFVSALPVFWSWRIALSNDTQVQLRFIIWIIPLLSPLIVRLRTHQKMKNHSPLNTLSRKVTALKNSAL